MGKKAKKELRFDTKQYFNDCSYCKNCPAKIYQKENGTILYGKGNLFADIMFVLPIECYGNEDVIAHLNTICWNIVNKDSEYITYHPKCKANSPVEGYEDICKYHLFHEISKIEPKKIVFFGVDIPDELKCFSNIYKLNNLLSIYYDFNKILKFRNELKEIIYGTS